MNGKHFRREAVKIKKFNSYVEFTAFGVYCDDFINSLISSKHHIFDITSSGGIYTAKIVPSSYPEIARQARAFKSRTRVVERRGIYFLLRRYKKRIGILFGLLSMLGVIVLMSNFIWDIDISGNESVGDYQILEQLDECGIHSGAFIRSFNANEAELKMLLNIEQLSWASVERSGSRINVKVSEAMPRDEAPKIPQTTPCDIISSNSGRLVEAEVYKGELVYKIGSGINKGDVVISGRVKSGLSVNNDAEIEETLVHADGRVIIEVIEEVEFYESHTVSVKSQNGHSKTNKSVIFLGKRFNLPWERLEKDMKIDKYFDNIKYFEEFTAPKILGFPLPFRILKQNYVFYETAEITNSPDKTRENLDKQINLYEMNFFENDDVEAEVIDKEIQYYPDENGISALVRYVFQVNSAIKSEILIPNS